MSVSYLFAQLYHAAVKRYHKGHLHTIVVRTNVSVSFVRYGVVAHVKRAKRHGSSVARTVSTKYLSTWCTVVLELHCLVSHVTSCSGYRVRSVLYLRIFCVSRCYCEKIESEVVVEVDSIVSVMSIVSTTPASRVVISRDQGSPEVVTENVVLSPAMSALGVTFDPLHEL